MNKYIKSNNSLIAIILTLFICILSAKNSHAATAIDQLVKVINHKIQTEKMGVGAAIVVIDGNKTEFHNVGLSQLASQTPVNHETLFEIGSITKTFTATALASMVKEGKVKLSDPVQDFLPKNVTLPFKNSKPITLLSLANHTSGLPRLPTNMPMTIPLIHTRVTQPNSCMSF